MRALRALAGAPAAALVAGGLALGAGGASLAGGGTSVAPYTSGSGGNIGSARSGTTQSGTSQPGTQAASAVTASAATTDFSSGPAQVDLAAFPSSNLSSAAPVTMPDVSGAGTPHARVHMARAVKPEIDAALPATPDVVGANAATPVPEPASLAWVGFLATAGAVAVARRRPRTKA